MQVRIQYRFLMKLLAFLAVMALVLFGLHRFQLNRNSLQVLTQARKAMEADKPSEAIRLYNQFLGLRRDSAEAHVELGDILSKQGNPKGAMPLYESALRIDPKLNEVRESVVKIAIDMGRYVDAKETLSTYLIPNDRAKAEYQWLLGVCEYRIGEFAEAEKHMTLAAKMESRNPAYASALAELLKDRLNDAEKGKNVLDELIKNAPEDPDAYQARSRFLVEQGRSIASVEKNVRDAFLEAAWQDAQTANRLAPNTPKHVLFMANVAAICNRTLEVRETVRSTLEAHPDEPDLYAMAARIEIAANQRAAALQILKDGLNVIPGNPELLFNLAVLQLDSGKVPESEALIVELKSRKFRESAVRFLEARVLAAKGQWRQAATSLEQSRALFDRDQEFLKQADFLSAICYRNIGSPDQEVDALQRALRADPNWAAAREALANALLRSGNIQESITELSQIVNQPNAPLSAGMSLARLLFVNGLGRGATGEAWEPLRQLLTRLEVFPEAANDLAILRSELLVVEKQPEEAETLLKTRLESDPKVPQLHQALVAIQIQKKAWDEAERSLDSAEKSLGNSVTVRLERARYLIRRYGKQVDLNELERLSVPEAAWDSKQKAQLASGFAGYFFALGDFERGKKFADVVAESEEGQSNLSIHLLLFELAFRSNDLTGMAKSLEQVKKIEGTGPLWRYGEAVRLSVEAKNLADTSQGSKVDEIDALFTKVIGQLTEAAVERPNWARIPRLRGEINDRQNKKDLAIEGYLEAIRLGEQSPQMVTRAIVLLFEQGRFGEADEVLLKLQEQKAPFSEDLTRMASQISLELENFDRAIDLANDWAIQSDRQEDHVWLAQVHSNVGNFVKAEEEFRIAIDKNKTAPGPWVALVQMFERAGNRDAALKVIDDAASVIQEEDRDNALAQAYHAVQDYENAGLYYKKAMETRANDVELMRRYAGFCLSSGQMEIAEPILVTLASETTNATEETQSWARRALSLVVGLRTSEDSLEKARELLAINAQKSGPNNADLRTLAIILSTRSDGPSTTESISLLEQLAKSEPKFLVDDHFLLANLYLRSGDLSRYSRTMRRVLGGGGGSNSNYVRSYAEVLFNRKEIPESTLWIEQLKKLAPKELSTASLESQLLFHNRDFAQLVKLLNSNRGQSEPERELWAAQIAESAGTQLMRIGKTKDAKQFLDIARESYAEIAKVDPKRTLALAAYLARIGEIKESLELLRGSDLPPDEVGELIQGVLQTGSLKEADARELVGVAQTVQAKHPKNVSVNHGLGDLWSWLTVGSEAASAYQMALEVEPNNVPVLNNLAMLLALTGPKLTEANEFIEQAVKVAGPMDYLLDTRGIVRFASGNIQGAEKDILKAIEVSPRPDRFFHLAQVLTSQGRLDDARAALKKAQDGGVTAEALHPLERKAFETLLKTLLK